ncbi:MAG: MlaE family lipid ABC transporter permease subunit [Alphaproteobacteria bacterium]|nr:MlaE family lipid ABC transporter permease subunit [Alphaproteobacteria bacterium]
MLRRGSGGLNAGDAVSDREWVKTSRDDDRLKIVAAGPWTIRHAPDIERQAGALTPNGARQAVFDLSRLDAIDTAGALVLFKVVDRFKNAGVETEVAGAPGDFSDLLARVAEAEERHAVPQPPVGRFSHSLEVIGHSTVQAFREGRDLLSFFGLTIVVFGRIIARPRRLRLISTINNMESAGVRALPIVGLLSFLIGVVLAYQGADQLRQFGAEIFTVNLLAVSVLREIGILLTAILVAGRSGSAFTAQIGTMKVREEIDAMETIGMDPMEVLVLPRIIALVIVLPLLGVYADIMGMTGGAIMSMLVLDISLTAFIEQLRLALTPWTIWIGLMKAPVFAFLIAMVGCFQGLRVEGSAESVGRKTTQSVVQAIFLVIIADAVFSIIFSTLHI